MIKVLFKDKPTKQGDIDMLAVLIVKGFERIEEKMATKDDLQEVKEELKEDVLQSVAQDIAVKNGMEFKMVDGLGPKTEDNVNKILDILLNKNFSREDIGQLIELDKERSIDVIITRLRKKIEIDPKNPKFLQTIRGAGYVLWIE